jgi:FkbM family methyltransferase
MDKEKIKKHIINIEKLRNKNKLERFLYKPFKTFFYYILASMARIRPFNIKFKTLWGDKMYADLPNGNTFFYYGYPEANLTNYLINNIKTDTVFIDGGANLGFYSMLVSKLVDNKTTIHAFEPTPSTFKKLKLNTNNKNIKLNNCALLDTEKKINFIDYGLGYNSFNSIFKRDVNFVKALNKRGSEIEVVSTTLDLYCEKNKIIPSFIKLDLEGSEYYAIQGSIKTITKYKPDISLEVAGDDEWSENIHKSDYILKELGYKSFKINLDGSIESHDLKDKYSYDNLIYKHTD